MYHPNSDSTLSIITDNIKWQFIMFIYKYHLLISVSFVYAYTCNQALIKQ